MVWTSRSEVARAGLIANTRAIAERALDRYWDRVDYIHFKDIDADVFRDVMGERIRFFDACARGVMCPIGKGSIDYVAIHDFLISHNYAGYITVEQERDPRNAGSILDDLAASRTFLADAGFGTRAGDIRSVA